MAIKVWSLLEKFKLSELNANFQEVGGSSSYTPIASIGSKLGRVETHLAIKKGGIVRYKLSAQNGTWAVGASYTICTLESDYRPSVEFRKVVVLGASNTQIAHLIIRTDGVVLVLPRVNMTDVWIYIDETFTL